MAPTFLRRGSTARTTRYLTRIFFALALFLTGCGSSVERAVEQTVEQTAQIDPTGTLSIRNAFGSVRIYGSDNPEMRLKAIKKAWSAGQLNGIEVKVAAQAGSVSVETGFPPQKTWGFSDRSGTVNYEITLPRTVKIHRLDVGNGDVLVEGMRAEMRANLVNGALAARNCFGKAQLSVANGALDLLYEKWERREFSIDGRIISGNVRAFLPSTASFHIVAETLNGNVINRFAQVKKDDTRKANKINMSTGTEVQPEINLWATDGNIEIAAAESQ